MRPAIRRADDAAEQQRAKSKAETQIIQMEVFRQERASSRDDCYIEAKEQSSECGGTCQKQQVADFSPIPRAELSRTLFDHAGLTVMSASGPPQM
jgi:hypothetical protein